MTTSNKNFKVKNGLEVLGTLATVNGNDILTVASSIAALADVDLTGAVEGNSLVFDASLNLIPGQGAGGGSAKYIVSDTKPLDPTDGLVWYNSLTSESFIYIVDLDSEQWVELGGMGPQGPTGPAGADSTVPGPQGDQGESGIVAQATAPSDTTVMWYDTSVEGYGIPLGGVTGQVLTKIDGADHNTSWQTPYGQTDADADIAALVDGAPTALNTLNKIAASIADDADFAGTVQDGLDTKANLSHTHAILDITNLQTALDAKSNDGHNHDDAYYTKAQANDLLATKADEVHTHDDRYYTETEMNVLLADKASETHNHAISDVTGLQNSLDVLQTNIDGKANTSHIHQISHVTGLQTALDAKASYSHIHDDRYYTESETDTLLNAKANLASPSLTGTVTAEYIAASQRVTGTTPNDAGSTGGLAVKAPAGGSQTSAYLQFVNNAYSAQWGSIEATPSSELKLNATYVKIPNQPTFFAYQPESGTYTIAAGTPVFTTATMNTGSAYNTSNGRFTAPIAGVYQFNGMMLCRTNTGAGEMTFLKNGVNVVSRNLAYSYPVGASAHDPVHITMYLSLAAGDYVQINVTQPSGGDWYYGGGLGWFAGRLVG